MSDDSSRPSSSQVAHEAEDTRANLASTLEQLRYNLRPENVMDEVVSNARAGVASVADNIAGAARQYPIAAMVLATGSALVTSLFAKPSRTGSSPSGRRGPAGLSPALRDRPAPGSTAAAETVRDGVGNVKQRASMAYASTSAQAGDALRSVSRYLPNDGREVRSKLSNLLEEQPLILGVIGLAVGAAIGAALPMSETEDSLMGGTAHRVRETAQDAVRQEYEGIRAAAGEAVDKVRHSASDNLSGFVHDVGASAKSVVDRAGGSLDASQRDI